MAKEKIFKDGKKKRPRQKRRKRVLAELKRKLRFLEEGDETSPKKSKKKNQNSYKTKRKKKHYHYDFNTWNRSRTTGLNAADLTTNIATIETKEFKIIDVTLDADQVKIKSEGRRKQRDALKSLLKAHI